MLQLPPIYTLFPYTTLFRSPVGVVIERVVVAGPILLAQHVLGKRHEGGEKELGCVGEAVLPVNDEGSVIRDRKSTRLNSSHPSISYAVFCLKKKKIHHYITE